MMQISRNCAKLFFSSLTSHYHIYLFAKKKCNTSKIWKTERKEELLSLNLRVFKKKLILIKLIYFVLCVCMPEYVQAYIHINICTLWVQVAPEDRRGHLILWIWVYRQFWASCCFWWKPKFSATTVNALNSLVISCPEGLEFLIVNFTMFH